MALGGRRIGFCRLPDGPLGADAAAWGRRSASGFTAVGGKIVEIDAIADAARLRELDLAVLDD